MILGSCQPSLIQTRNIVPKAFSIPFIGHPWGFLPFPMRKLDLIGLFPFFFFKSVFRTITGNRQLSLLLLILYQRNEGANMRKQLNQIRNLTKDKRESLWGGLCWVLGY